MCSIGKWKESADIGPSSECFGKRQTSMTLTSTQLSGRGRRIRCDWGRRWSLRRSLTKRCLTYEVSQFLHLKYFSKCGRENPQKSLYCSSNTNNLNWLWSLPSRRSQEVGKPVLLRLTLRSYSLRVLPRSWYSMWMKWETMTSTTEVAWRLSNNKFLLNNNCHNNLLRENQGCLMPIKISQFHLLK